jgi:uncharacterized protein (DUF924 family)
VTPLSAGDVLAFWFPRDPADEAEVMALARRWFQGGEAMDHEVIPRFGAAVESAVAGGLGDWERSPRERLALVLLLDQLTRNVFRGQARMFAGDPRAQKLALAAWDDGSAETLSFVEQSFLTMPLLHSESLAHHEREAGIARALAARATGPWPVFSRMRLEQSAKYLDVIRRFGRFPHRNAVLGRGSTAQELAFLADWDQAAPPEGMKHPPEK